MTSPHMPTVYLIAGPNGAGKTTFASKFLPGFVDCTEFLNADLIAAGLAPFAPETQNFRAGRLLLERVRELSARKEDFGFETTLAGRTYATLLKSMRDEGYQIMLFFLWLPSADMAASRVANRVRQGGHHVPEADIRRRYDSGLKNLFGIYQEHVDAWWLYDSSRLPPRVIASQEQEGLQVVQADMLEMIQQQVEGRQE